MTANAVVEFRLRLGRRSMRSADELREQAERHKQQMAEFAAVLKSAFDAGVRALEVTDRTRRLAILIQQQRDGILRVGRFDDRGAVGHIELDPERYDELARELFSMLSADPGDPEHLTVRLLSPSHSLVEFWLQQPLGKWGMEMASVIHESNRLRVRGDYEEAHRLEAEALARMGPAPAPTPIPETVGGDADALVAFEQRLKELRLQFWKGDATAGATALQMLDEWAARGDPAAQVVRLSHLAAFTTPGRGLPWKAAGLPAINVQAELVGVLDAMPRTRAAWEALVRGIVSADLAALIVKRKNVAQLRKFVEDEVASAGHQARIEAWGAGLREETTSGSFAGVVDEGRRPGDGGYGEVVVGAAKSYEALKDRLLRPNPRLFPPRVVCRPDPERVEKWREYHDIGPYLMVERLAALHPGRRPIWVAIDTALQLLREQLPEMAWIDTNVTEYVHRLALGESLPVPVRYYIDMPDPRAGRAIDAGRRGALYSALAVAEEAVDRSIAAPGSRRAWKRLGDLRNTAARIIWFAHRAFAQPDDADASATFAHYAACWEEMLEDRLRFQLPTGPRDVVSGPAETSPRKTSPRNPYPPGSPEQLLFTEAVARARKYPETATAPAMASWSLLQQREEPHHATWPEVVPKLVQLGILASGDPEPIDPANFDRRFTIPGCTGTPVVWDSREGLGATGNNADIRWFGFVALMRPETFLRLALSLDTPRERTTTGLEQYRAMPGWAPPMLYINAADPEAIRVLGHEGRHRATVYARLCPHALLPVAFMPQYQRAKDMTPEALRAIRAGMFSERDRATGSSRFIAGPLFDELFVRDSAANFREAGTSGLVTVGGRLWNPGINWASDAIVLRERAGVLEVLLGLRNPKQAGGRRQWALLGGFRDKGETAEQAARREAREEGGINLQPRHRIGKTRVYGGPGTRYDPRDEADRWIQTQGFVYLVPSSMEPRCVQDPDGGIIDARFVPVEMALRRRLFASHNELLADAVEVWQRRPM